VKIKYLKIIICKNTLKEICIYNIIKMEIENTSFSEGYKFCDMKFLRTFLNMSITDQAILFSKLFRDDIKFVGKEIVFYYNVTTKLWVETN
jgi:hypothetical protein